MGDDGRDFATLLRQAMSRRRISLRALQMRLRDRGHEISVATLSMWSSGARTPSSDAALDVVLELEDLLHLDDGELVSTVRPRRRVPEDRNTPLAEMLDGVAESFMKEKLPRELSERSGTVIYHLDAEGRVVRRPNRTVYQARVDGAQDVTVFVGFDDAELRAPKLRGLLGCTIVDVDVNLELRLMRVTLRLEAPLRKGEVVLVEWETCDHIYSDEPPEDTAAVFAPRRQAEVGIHIFFDPDRLPRSCRATVESDGGVRSFPLVINGAVASHVEFDFGPGQIDIFWDW